MKVFAKLSEGDARVLAEVLMQDDKPVTKEDLAEALLNLRERQFRRTLKQITELIKKAEAKGDTKRVHLLLAARKAVEGEYLMRKHANAELESEQLEWWRGLELVDQATAAARKLR